MHKDLRYVRYSFNNELMKGIYEESFGSKLKLNNIITGKYGA